MKSKILQNSLIVTSALVLFSGCGGGGGGGTDTTIPTTYDDTLLKLFAVANKTNNLDFKRVEFQFTQYADVSTYIQSLRNSVICSSGTITFDVNQNGYGCGDYNITANNCVISSTETLNGKIQKWLTPDSTFSPSECRYTKSLVHSDWRTDINFFGTNKQLVMKTNTVKEFNNNDKYDYTVTIDGNVSLDNQIYTLNNFKTIIDTPIANQFNPYDGSITDGTNTLQFTNLGTPANLSINYQAVSTAGYFKTISNNQYYDVYLGTDAKVKVLKDSVQISNSYNFNEIFNFSY